MTKNHDKKTSQVDLKSGGGSMALPRASRVMHLLSRAPQSTVTVVVPSPATMSCDFDSSTNIFAAVTYRRYLQL